MRALAFLACIPAVVGAWLLVDADDIGMAMAWLLIPAAVAGVVLSRRFYPLRLTGADTEFMNAAWKRTFADVGLIALGYLVILFTSAVATQFIEADLSVFGVNVFIVLMAAGSAFLGVVVSFITLIPMLMLGRALARAIAGREVDVEEIAGATLLLSVGIFATSLVLATTIDTGGSPRSEAWTAIFVLLTGQESENARIVSQPLAWVARAALAGIVASAIPLAIRARRRRREALAEG